MSIQGAMSAYEKMLQNPANRRSTSGELKQPMPNLAEAQGHASKNNTPTIEDADDLWIKQLDRKMARKKNLNESEGNDDQILQALNEVKELLKTVMNVNLKVLEKLK